MVCPICMIIDRGNKSEIDGDFHGSVNDAGVLRLDRRREKSKTNGPTNETGPRARNIRLLGVLP